jgi:hypothetical protein
MKTTSSYTPSSRGRAAFVFASAGLSIVFCVLLSFLCQELCTYGPWGFHWVR